MYNGRLVWRSSRHVRSRDQDRVRDQNLASLPRTSTTTAVVSRRRADVIVSLCNIDDEHNNASFNIYRTKCFIVKLCSQHVKETELNYTGVLNTCIPVGCSNRSSKAALAMFPNAFRELQFTNASSERMRSITQLLGVQALN